MDRTAKSIASAHQRIYNYLTIRGLKLKFEILDNECSHDLIKLMTKNDIIFQLGNYTRLSVVQALGLSVVRHRRSTIIHTRSE